MATSPSSLLNREWLELEEALRFFSTEGECPKQFSEPGVFLHYVLRQWKRDGRAGHMTDVQLAELISRRIGRHYGRNSYQAMFEGSMRTGSRKKFRQPIPLDVAEAYLEIAFANWTKNPDGTLSPFVPMHDLDLEIAIDNVIALMRSLGNPVLCRPNSEVRLDSSRDISFMLERMIENGIRPISLDDILYLTERLAPHDLMNQFLVEYIKELLKYRKQNTN